MTGWGTRGLDDRRDRPTRQAKDRKGSLQRDVDKPPVTTVAQAGQPPKRDRPETANRIAPHPPASVEGSETLGEASGLACHPRDRLASDNRTGDARFSSVTRVQMQW